jgi:hypothetical protein
MQALEDIIDFKGRVRYTFMCFHVANKLQYMKIADPLLVLLIVNMMSTD